MYHVYLYEIQEVNFKLKYGGIQDYSLFVIENISNIYYVNSFAGIQKLKKKTNVIYKKFLLYVEFPLHSTSCYFKFKNDMIQFGGNVIET